MPNNQFDVTKAKIIPERTGPNLLTREYPTLSGFLQGVLGMAPDEVGGGSVLDEDAQSNRALQALGAKYGFPIGAASAIVPGVRQTLQALYAAPRTARNIARVVQGVAPREAILDELTRVKSPVERAASSSARGWVSPVSKGDMTGVDYPEPGVLSALTKATTVGHTHPMTEGYRYAPLSPADKPVLRGKPVTMEVYHTYRDSGKPTGWTESLDGAMSPQPIDDLEVAKYMDLLEKTSGYTTDVPRSMRPNGIIQKSKTSKLASTAEDLDPEELAAQNEELAEDAFRRLRENLQEDDMYELDDLVQEHIDNSAYVVPYTDLLDIAKRHLATKNREVTMPEYLSADRPAWGTASGPNPRNMDRANDRTWEETYPADSTWNRLGRTGKFADGGPVNTGYNPDAINARAAQLMEELGL